jgi:outer membrane protein assembly factor BamB
MNAIPGLRGFGLALCVVLASACSTPDNSEPPAPLTEIDNPIEVERMWNVSTGKGVELNYYDLQPLLIDDSLYTIDTRGLMQKIDAQSGDVAWEFQSGLRSISGLAGAKGSLIASSSEGELVRFDLADDGPVKVWSSQIGSEIRNKAVLADQQILLRTLDGKLLSLDFNSGEQQWSVARRVPPLSLTGTSHPLVVGDLVFAGYDNGKLLALERKGGSPVWESTVGVPTGRSEIERLVDLDGQFIARDGVIYASSFQGNLVAIVISNGQILWSREFSSFQAIEADDEALYLTDEKSHVWSIDRRTGSAFWKQDALNARKLTAPRLVGDKLVVADLEGYVHVLKKQDGTLAGRIATGEHRYISQPLVVGDFAVVLDAAGSLTALSLQP